MTVDHLRHQKYKNNQSNKRQVLKVQKGSLELEKNFKQFKVLINDMDKLEKKNQQKKERLPNNCTYGSLKKLGGVRDQIMIHFKTKDYIQPKRVKIVC